jgi:LysR family hydrogen peroxide-inducible transcriptional activator
MQMVACGYGVTLVPEVAIDVELRDDRVKLLRFAEPQPSRIVGLVWRRTSPRELDFKSLGQMIANSFNGPRQDMRATGSPVSPRALEGECAADKGRRIPRRRESR